MRLKNKRSIESIGQASHTLSLGTCEGKENASGCRRNMNHSARPQKWSKVKQIGFAPIPRQPTRLIPDVIRVFKTSQRVKSGDNLCVPRLIAKLNTIAAQKLNNIWFKSLLCSKNVQNNWEKQWKLAQLDRTHVEVSLLLSFSLSPRRLHQMPSLARDCVIEESALPARTLFE